jgi:F-type H+-transporting ATPase subunit epsilon
MAKLSIEIVTPEKRVLTGEADEAIVPGFHGLFGVRPGHTPFLSLMEDGLLTLKNEGAQQIFHVEGGFVEVGDDRVRVLANNAYPASAIDVNAAKKKLEEAQGNLSKLSSDDERFGIESAVVKRETAKLASAGRR